MPELDPTVPMTSRTFLPARHGGLGFQSMRITAPAAMAASWHAHLPAVLARLDPPMPAALEFRSPIAQHFFPLANITLRNAFGDDTISAGDGSVTVSQHEFAWGTLAAAASSMMERAAWDIPLAASMRSAGGLGAGACLRLSLRPCHSMLNEQLSIVLRFRLHLPIPCMRGQCGHGRPDGTRCDATLDDKGVHARSCRTCGWLVKCHNA